MSRLTKTLLALVIVAMGFFFAVCGFVAVYTISTYNRAVGMEEGIKATYTNMQSMTTQYYLKLSESIQLPNMAKKDTIEMIDSIFKGRYGNDGSKAMIQMIQEKNPDTKSVVNMYGKIQTIIDAGRTDYLNKEAFLRDQKRALCTMGRKFPSKYVLNMFDIPSIKIGCNDPKEDDYKIIMSAESVKIFETGMDSGFKFSK